jgi:hypothetical protein
VCAGGPAEEYCNRLETQNSSEDSVRLMVLFANFLTQLYLCLFFSMMTQCCTCCCCCARPGNCEHISTGCSRGCFHFCGRLMTCCGVGWCGYLFLSNSSLTSRRTEKRLVLLLTLDLLSDSDEHKRIHVTDSSGTLT